MRVSLREVGDGTLLAEFPGSSEDTANRAAVSAARRLAGKPGLLDAIPGARTLFVVADATLDREALRRELEVAGEPSTEPPPRAVRVPVLYGGPAALDLEELARGAGFSPEEFVRRHAAASYRVAFLGFAPGFGYCVGLPAELAAPRLSTPRTRVPGGTLAIGSRYTGVYPADTPGGWRLIGTSRARFFDPFADSPTLLRPGDALSFVPVEDDGDEPEPPVRAAARPAGEALFRVHQPGLFSSLQGMARHGRGELGVPAGGAMDPAALASCNRVLGNPPGAAGLEITLAGPELTAFSDCRAAITNNLEAQNNGLEVPGGRPFEVRRDDRLRLTHVAAGARAYFCVEGGFDVPAEQWTTRPLRKEDTLDRAAAFPASSGLLPPLPAAENGIVRVRLGPQEDCFEERSIAALFAQSWRVSASSDRRGVRLEGQALRHSGSAEVAPEGTALGAIQVPADGQPIVLGPDRPVTGGYAKIATVALADWPIVAQAVPGSFLRFRLA